MDPKRQGEIALKLVKYMLSPDNVREMENIAKGIGVPLEELKQFAQPLAQELLNEYFA